MLFPNRTVADTVEGRPRICMPIRYEPRVYIYQSSKTWEVVPTDRKTIPRSREKMAVVLDAGSCGFCDYKLYHGRGCGSILSSGITNRIIELLLVPDVADYNVCCMGERAALGKLAGKTND